jgi:hypothetical protein
MDQGMVHHVMCMWCADICVLFKCFRFLFSRLSTKDTKTWWFSVSSFFRKTKNINAFFLDGYWQLSIHFSMWIVWLTKSKSLIRSETMVTYCFFFYKLQICTLHFPQYIGISKATAKQEGNRKRMIYSLATLLLWCDKITLSRNLPVCSNTMKGSYLCSVFCGSPTLHGSSSRNPWCFLCSLSSQDSLLSSNGLLTYLSNC